MIFNRPNWKKMIKIGSQDEIHYLDKQRIIMLNALLIIVLSLSFILSAVALFFIQSIHFTAFILPAICLVALFLNANKNPIVARHFAFWSVVLVITFWCFTTRRVGFQFLFIAIASSSIVIFRKKALSFLAMFVCSLFYLTYIIYDNATLFI